MVDGAKVVVGAAVVEVVVEFGEVVVGFSETFEERNPEY